MIATLTPPESPFTTGLTPWAQTLPQHISPTAAKSYLSCSLRFYFERVEAATGETPPSLDLVFLVKTKSSQVIRVSSPPADAHRKRRVIALLETAVEGIASNRHNPQPGMHCSWCQYRNECMAWLPNLYQERRAA